MNVTNARLRRSQISMTELYIIRQTTMVSCHVILHLTTTKISDLNKFVVSLTT